jgi:hypothetical protein
LHRGSSLLSPFSSSQFFLFSPKIFPGPPLSRCNPFYRNHTSSTRDTRKNRKNPRIPTAKEIFRRLERRALANSNFIRRLSEYKSNIASKMEVEGCV